MINYAEDRMQDDAELLAWATARFDQSEHVIIGYGHGRGHLKESIMNVPVRTSEMGSKEIVAEHMLQEGNWPLDVQEENISCTCGCVEPGVRIEGYPVCNDKFLCAECGKPLMAEMEKVLAYRNEIKRNPRLEGKTLGKGNIAVIQSILREVAKAASLENARLDDLPIGSHPTVTLDLTEDVTAFVKARIKRHHESWVIGQLGRLIEELEVFK